MAAKILKKKTIDITAVLNITDDNNIILEVEDIDTPMNLADLVKKDFNGEAVKISFAQSEDIA